MFSEYMEELKKIKLLSREEEIVLWQRKASGDIQAHNLLIRSYQPLVFKTALSFGLSPEDMMELVQEGTLGLLEAAEHYDYTRGVAFSIFALHRIRGRMLNFMRRECADNTLSLDSEIMKGSGVVWSDLLISEEASPSERAERSFMSDKILAALERLPLREHQVLEAIYLENKRPVDIAEAINVTTAHVYRLQKQGVRRVRGMLSRLMGELKRD